MLSLQVLGFLTGKEEHMAGGRGWGGQVTVDTSEGRTRVGRPCSGSHQQGAEMCRGQRWGGWVGSESLWQDADKELMGGGGQMHLMQSCKQRGRGKGAQETLLVAA